MDDADEPPLTGRGVPRDISLHPNQYYHREPIVPFQLMLASMTPWTPGDDPRKTDDPATWHDWIKSVEAARGSEQLPEI